MDESNNGTFSFLMFLVSVIVVPVLVVTGANYAPDEFDLNDETFAKQHVWNLSHLDSVEHPENDAILLRHKAQVAIEATVNATMYQGEWKLALDEPKSASATTGATFILRTTKHQYQQDSTYGIAVTYSSKGVTIRENGKVLQQIDSIKASSTPERIFVENDGANTRLIFGCRPAINIRTSLPATRHVILKSEGATTVRANTFTFYAL
jgi:hypothetical protein